MNDRYFWRPPKRHYSRRIEAPVAAADLAFVSASAISLSTSALFASLMLHLQEKGIMSAEDKMAVYERALELLETDPADDGGVTELACAIIYQQLLPE